jgi:hypothetical protein
MIASLALVQKLVVTMTMPVSVYLKMQDIDDDASTQQYLRSSNQEGSHNKRAAGQTAFVVQGAPWEQQQSNQPKLVIS